MSEFFLKLKIRSRAAKRLVMWHFCSGWMPLYLVSEFPKSGGTWFSQMLAELLNVPFYRNTESQKLRKSVVAGHRLYSPNFKNVTLVFRDGRDVLVSAYYHFLFKNDINRSFTITKHRNNLRFADYEDIQSNLPRFIEYMFVDYTRQGMHFSWSQFIDSWWEKDAHHVKYEDLLARPVPTLRSAAERLVNESFSDEQIQAVVDKFAFKKMAGRNAGEENKSSFVRKGIAGDWRNNFSHEACQVFAQFAGEHLIRLGYEKDSSWIENQSLQTASNK
jgi:Sulfotransferase domain